VFNIKKMSRLTKDTRYAFRG